MQENVVLTVTELTCAIKKKLEGSFSSIRVQGEIINFKEQASGHLYFTLKDSLSQISAVFFRGNAQRMKQLPKNGDQVLAKGEINVYAPRGNYQLIVRELEYVGVGELLLKLHLLKEKLQSLGWFETSRKKPLPSSPKIIGVVTSSTGAVIQDILNVLSRRCKGFHLILNPVRVQGSGAAQEIAQAIDQFNQYRLADVLIVCRGGGSLEDLWPFNEEVVARAIFNSGIPVISAVGHEVDFSISDFVADVRAATPSVAAEIVTVASEKHRCYLEQVSRELDQAMFQRLRGYRNQLESCCKQPTLSSPFALLGIASQRLDGLSEEIGNAMRHLITIKKLQLQNFDKRLRTLDPRVQVHSFRQRLSQLTAHLHSIDPKNLLKKGYSILFQENGRSIIFSSKDISIGRDVSILMQDAEVKAKVIGFKRLEKGSKDGV